MYWKSRSSQLKYYGLTLLCFHSFGWLFNHGLLELCLLVQRRSIFSFRVLLLLLLRRVFCCQSHAVFILKISFQKSQADFKEKGIEKSRHHVCLFDTIWIKLNTWEFSLFFFPFKLVDIRQERGIVLFVSLHSLWCEVKKG